MNEDEKDDSIKTFVLEQLPPSVITFEDELNLSVILGENDSKESLDENNLNVVSSNLPEKEEKLPNLQCSICEKVFANKRYLNRHFSKHTNRFKCTICEKVLCRKETLLKHVSLCKNKRLSPSRIPKKVVVSRQDINKFSCKDCSKSFTRRENYDEHVMSHFGMKVVCYICQKVMKSFKSYRRHIRNHQVEKPIFHCALCPANFSLQSNLRRHLLQQHLSEVVCDKCNHKVKNMRMLQKHQNNEPLKCLICSELFCLGTDFKSHLKTMHHDLWFSCKLCAGVTPFMTKCDYNLREHVRKMHRIILETGVCYKDGWYLFLRDE